MNQKDQPSLQRRESWGSRIGVILAVMGSAVGLGNFLRFPGLAAQYEGGAFMIPYFIALLLIGLPLAWAEWAMGRYGGTKGYNSSPGIYRAIWGWKGASYFGVISLLVPVGIYMYYIVVEAWCLGYAWYYLNGTMAALGEQARAAAEAGALDKSVYVQFFQQVTASGAHGAAFSGAAWEVLVFLAICFTINFTLIYRGLSKGIERFCLIALPLLIVCAILVLIRVLTLDNIGSGLGFMWNLGFGEEGFWDSLADPGMWLAATSQIFFTLSVGFGIIITYSSYLKRNDDIALGSLTAVSGNEFCEIVLAGMAIVPAAFIFLGAMGREASGWSTFNLGFLTLPMVFELMPLGYVVGFLFFFLLFLAAVTSSISMLQPAIALLEEGLGLTRRASVSILGFVTLIGAGFVLYFSGHFAALATFDFWVGQLLIFVIALFQILLFGWGLGVKGGLAELDRGADMHVPRFIGYLLKYVSPVYLAAILISWIWSKATVGGKFTALAQDPIRALSVGFLFVVGLLMLLLIIQSNRRWNRMGPPHATDEGRDDDESGGGGGAAGEEGKSEVTP